MEPKQKQYPVVDVTGDRSKVQCWKEQYCHWNLECQVHESRQIGHGQAEDGISELKWMEMGEFNSDGNFIYYCGQESLRRYGGALTVK